MHAGNLNGAVVIVGVGSTLMGDDGIGPAAIEALRRRGLGDRAELIDAGLAFSEVLCDLDPSRALIVIDAVRGPGEPGSIYQLTVDDFATGQRPPARGARNGPKNRDHVRPAVALSLHEVSVLPALQMEALAGRRFADVTVFGVQPQRIAWGEGLSEPVAAAMEELIHAVAGRLGQVETRAASARPARGSEDR